METNLYFDANRRPGIIDTHAPAAGLVTGATGFNMRRGSLVRTYNVYDKFTFEERTAMANTWQFQCILSDMIMGDMINYYVREAEKQMTEAGLMRHNLKRRMGEIRSLSDSLMRLISRHRHSQVTLICRPMFATLSDEYFDEGGEFYVRLFNGFREMCRQDLDLVYLCTKNMINHTLCPHADLVTSLQMVLLMAHTSIEFNQAVQKRVEKLIADIADVEVKKTQHCEKLVSACKAILDVVFDDEKYPASEKDLSDCRRLACKFQEKLAGEEMRELIDRSAWDLRRDFMVFVSVRLRQKLDAGCMTRADLRCLLERLGTKQNVRAVIDALLASPLPDIPDADVFDLMDAYEIPDDGPHKEVMHEFMRLCVENRVKIPSEEDITTRVGRYLRRMVYRSYTATVPDEYLAFMYHTMGTKKAVTALLESAGKEVMARTIKHFRGMKAEQMQRPADRYWLDFGYAVRRMREMIHLSECDFCRRSGVSKEKLQELEKLDPLKPVPTRVLRDMLYDLSKLVEVSPNFMVFLAVRPSGKEHIALEPFEQVLKRGLKLYGKEEK